MIFYQLLKFPLKITGEEEEEEEEYLGVSIDGSTKTVFLEVSIAVNTKLLRLFRRRSVWPHFAHFSIFLENSITPKWMHTNRVFNA